MQTGTDPVARAAYILADAPLALAFLCGLRANVENSHAAYIAASEEWQRLTTERDRARARLRQMRQTRDGLSAAEAAQAQLDRLEPQVKAAAARKDTAVNQAERRLLQKIDQWLARAPSRLSDADLPDPKLPKTKTVSDAIDDLRHDIAELAADAHEVMSAPVPIGDIEPGVRKFVSDLAGRAKLNVSQLAEGAPPEFVGQDHFDHLIQTVAVDAERSLAVRGMARRVQPDYLAVMAWLDPERMVERIMADAMDAAGEQSDALPQAEKTRQLAAIDAERLGLERAEEALIRRAAAGGLAIERRRDASPEATLAVGAPL
jgi:hypothetical protein